MKEAPNKHLNKQRKAWNEAVKAHGEMELDFFYKDGFIIPFCRRTGKIIANVKSVSAEFKCDDFATMKIEVNVQK